MVLERLVTIKEAIRRPWWMFFIGGIVSVVSLLVSFFVFPSSIGLFSTFLITIAMTPFMINLITYEETHEEEMIKRHAEGNFIQRHRQIISIYTAFFGGMIFFMSMIYLSLPETTIETIFNDQITEINLIRGNIVFPDIFSRIILNNTGVLFITFIFSLLFGAGAIFILAWNASILATAIGITAKSFGGIHGLPIAVITFFPHGSLEILAYFIGAIAGGLLSVALTRKRAMIGAMLKDASILMILSVVLLIAAAFVETISISLAS